MTTVTNDVISDKYGRSFDLLDADKDGYVEWPDYQALADRYINAYKLDRNDRRVRELTAFHQMQWLEVLRHAGGQGDRLDREQYVQAMRLLAVDTSRMNLVEGSGHAMFDVIDVDGDNEISKAEFHRFLAEVWQVTDPTAMDTFDKIDADGDGRVSRTEFIRTLREHYYSNDPSAPGSLIFGQV
ncbi:EF-hand domain-containing protein [Streptomyces sp. NPDC014779]|uniref:EF-hand domain-containing protein n=1 Tax=unclassified Streptomyces TaxID=2593676 RepID=UPI0033BB0F7F